MEWLFSRTGVPPVILEDITEGVLYELSTREGKDFRGIWSSLKDASVVQHFVHREFRENAAVYAKRHGEGDTRALVFAQLLERVQIRTSSVETILELGAGHGNGIGSLRTLCPDAAIIASDISPEMLSLLKWRWSGDSRVIPFQCDAEVPEFRPHSFDCIVGWGVLHHLYHPEKTIAACGRILKPGGVALFAEPMEEGHRVLTGLYRLLLSDERFEEIHPAAIQHFRIDGLHYFYRRMPSKTSPVFEHLEDKWVFTDAFFEEHASKHGLQCTILPCRFSCERKIAQNMRLLGLTEEALPHWAWERIRQVDALAEQEHAMSAFILLKRP